MIYRILALIFAAAMLTNWALLAFAGFSKGLDWKIAYIAMMNGVLLLVVYRLWNYSPRK